MGGTAHGTFEVAITPGAAEAGGDVARFEFTKTFTGDLVGTSVGIMLSAGDPQSGEAGYVAIELVRGSLGGLDGGFAFQQFGQMHDGAQTLTYRIVPGSGSGALAGVVGALDLVIDEDGTHRYELTYDL